MLHHDFEKKLNRRGTNCWKWDYEGKLVKYPMGVADTDFSIAAPIAESLHNKINEGALAYGAGCGDFYEAVSGYYERRHGVKISDKNIRFAPGLMVALNLFCEAFTRPGDMVILQPPVYHAFRKTIELAGRHVLDNPLIYNEDTCTYDIDFEDLEKKASNPRARIMIVCNPANPTCRAFSKEELARIFDICHRNHVIVVSDEVHSDIYYHGRKHISMLAASPEAEKYAIVMSADGKTFNLHGFYTSFVMLPNEWMRQQYDLAFQYNHLDYSVMGCTAATTAYSKCDYYVDELVEYLEGNLEYLRKFVKEDLKMVSMAEPYATYLMWLDFRKWGLSGTELHKFLADHGVGLSNGEKFGVGGEGFMRMNIACHRSTLEGALNAIKEAEAELSK